jgi:hypothetical protein
MEYNRVLKQDSKLYIEVPAPDCDRRHEWNLNHYSILGANQLAALLNRTGFDIDEFKTIEFDLTVGQKEDGTPQVARERFYCIVASKKRPLDIK